MGVFAAESAGVGVAVCVGVVVGTDVADGSDVGVCESDITAGVASGPDPHADSNRISPMEILISIANFIAWLSYIYGAFDPTNWRGSQPLIHRGEADMLPGTRRIIARFGIVAKFIRLYIVVRYFPTGHPLLRHRPPGGIQGAGRRLPLRLEGVAQWQELGAHDVVQSDLLAQPGRGGDPVPGEGLRRSSRVSFVAWPATAARIRAQKRIPPLPST